MSAAARRQRSVSAMLRMLWTSGTRRRNSRIARGGTSGDNNTRRWTKSAAFATRCGKSVSDKSSRTRRAAGNALSALSPLETPQVRSSPRRRSGSVPFVKHSAQISATTRIPAAKSCGEISNPGNRFRRLRRAQDKAGRRRWAWTRSDTRHCSMMSPRSSRAEMSKKVGRWRVR